MVTSHFSDGQLRLIEDRCLNRIRFLPSSVANVVLSGLMFIGSYVFNFECSLSVLESLQICLQGCSYE